jgi:hypothetical protein
MIAPTADEIAELHQWAVTHATVGMAQAKIVES